MKRLYVVTAVLVLAAGALLFGSRLPGLGGSPDTDGTTTSSTLGLTDAEREWCEDHPGRVAGVTHFDSQREGAPALLESERLTGELQPATLEAFTAWADAHADLYDRACGDAFSVWAGR